jgi:hypothetical protein
MKAKRYPVPQEVVSLIQESEAAGDCRSDAIRLLFFANRAIYYGKISVEKSDKAWDVVRELYPDIGKKNLTLIRRECAVVISSEYDMEEK